MKSPVIVSTIRSTCCACPSQWEGLTDDERVIYVRYRWGHLSVRVSEPNDRRATAGTSGQTIISLEYGGQYSGDLDYAQLKLLTSGIVVWPEKEC